MLRFLCLVAVHHNLLPPTLYIVHIFHTLKKKTRFFKAVTLDKNAFDKQRTCSQNAKSSRREIKEKSDFDSLQISYNKRFPLAEVMLINRRLYRKLASTANYRAEQDKISISSIPSIKKTFLFPGTPLHLFLPAFFSFLSIS